MGGIGDIGDVVKGVAEFDGGGDNRVRVDIGEGESSEKLLVGVDPGAHSPQAVVVEPECEKELIFITKLHQYIFYFFILSLNFSMYPGGKVRLIYIFYPLSSARMISLASVSLSVFVPELCFNFMCRLRETSVPYVLSQLGNGHS